MIENDFDFVIILHGDDQGAIKDIIPGGSKKNLSYVDTKINFSINDIRRRYPSKPRSLFLHWIFLYTYHIFFLDYFYFLLPIEAS